LNQSPTIVILIHHFLPFLRTHKDDAFRLLRYYTLYVLSRMSTTPLRKIGYIIISIFIAFFQFSVVILKNVLLYQM